MLGFNGGLIGKTRQNYSLFSTKSLPGVWTPNEQANAIKDSNWLTARDPDFSKVVLLLHGDGTNGSTTFIDNGPAPKTLVPNGNAQISTTQSKFGGASMSFVRSPSSYLTVSNATADFSFATFDFTIEAWVRLNSLPTGNGYPSGFWIVGGGLPNSGIGFEIVIGSTNLVVALNTFDSPTMSTAHSMAINTWYHIAVVRSGNTLYAFRDGTQLATANVSGITAEPMTSGMAISAAEPFSASTFGNFNGYIDELRITRGVARYTAAFTAPTEPFPNQ